MVALVFGQDFIAIWSLCLLRKPRTLGECTRLLNKLLRRCNIPPSHHFQSYSKSTSLSTIPSTTGLRAADATIWTIRSGIVSKAIVVCRTCLSRCQSCCMVWRKALSGMSRRILSNLRRHMEHLHWERDWGRNQLGLRFCNQAIH